MNILTILNRKSKLETYDDKLQIYVNLVHKDLGKTEEALKLRHELEKIHRNCMGLYQTTLEMQRRDIMNRLHNTKKENGSNI